MSLSYTHTLIPDQSHYTPHPWQVGDFFSALAELGALPTEAELQVTTPTIPHHTGGFPITRQLPDRIGEDPSAGDVLVLSGRYSTAIDAISGIAPALEGLDEYDLRMSGDGPPEPLFPFSPVGLNLHEERYPFDVSCHQRPNLVSMSDYKGHEGASTRVMAVLLRSLAPPSFGYPCTSARRTAFFTNPTTLETIRVPGVGCARFWIEFAFGKFLFPEIRNNSLNLLPPRVVEAAGRIFGVQFAQGCCWG